MRSILASVVLAVAVLLGPSAAQAAVHVSYLGIHHNGNDHAWKFVYDTADPVAPQTGYDLFVVLFGVPELSGTYTDGFGGVYDYLLMGDADNGLGLISFSGTDPFDPTQLFIESITLGGFTVAMDPSYDPFWAYFVAGGENGPVPEARSRQLTEHGRNPSLASEAVESGTDRSMVGR